MRGRLVVVGDALLDRDIDGRAERLSPESAAPVLDKVVETTRPGGAALAAVMAAADGADVVLVTAISDDEPGTELRQGVERGGVRVVNLGLEGPTPEKVRVRAQGRSLVRIDRGCDRIGEIGPVTEDAGDILSRCDGVLVADYGRGVARHPDLRGLLEACAKRAPVVWDPHPKGARPVTGVRLATPNRSEASQLAQGIGGEDLSAVTARAHQLKRKWQAANVAVTLGEEGALLVAGDAAPMMFPAARATGDSCGAGDRFSSAAALALMDGSLPSDAVARAVDVASAFVGGGVIKAFGNVPGAIASTSSSPGTLVGEPAPTEEALRLVGEVRRRGGTVVATGGCFDILHAGHLQLLRSARSLGDCLIVLLNSDRSVRKLKGPDRPLVTEHERAAILNALTCVDAVVVFDEDTPAEMLEILRPDIFAKGADYALSNLPETAVLARWGGQVVILPYLRDRSTTALLNRLTGRGAG
ncbi:MAG: D-glycero-beta-D-manno-heptose 1-phosphate adenylyltransferase [Actinomycetota bacterium]|nr:D-glycero-beta-D-manno-heptose 1-phosphate adenylyltransferase [Actinomycetota bacterium]